MFLYQCCLAFRCPRARDEHIAWLQDHRFEEEPQFSDRSEPLMPSQLERRQNSSLAVFVV